MLRKPAQCGTEKVDVESQFQTYSPVAHINEHKELAKEFTQPIFLDMEVLRPLYHKE